MGTTLEDIILGLKQLHDIGILLMWCGCFCMFLCIGGVVNWLGFYKTD